MIVHTYIHTYLPTITSPFLIQHFGCRGLLLRSVQRRFLHSRRMQNCCNHLRLYICRRSIRRAQSHTTTWLIGRYTCTPCVYCTCYRLHYTMYHSRGFSFVHAFTVALLSAMCICLHNITEYVYLHVVCNSVF